MMKGSRWWGIALIVLALALYSVGIAAGAAAVLILAVGVELAGWIKLLGSPRRR